jgi:integrase
MADQTSSGMNQKSVQDSGVLGHFSKSDIRYWQRAIFRQTYTRNGQTLVTRNWAMKIAHKGRRETFALGTPNKAAAAARARDIYLSLQVNGWDATLAKFKHPNEAARLLNANRPCTVGEFLAELSRMTTSQSTFRDYAQAFRQIVSEIFGFSNDTLKYDYRTGGREEWLSKVHAISLADVTPAKVQDWKLSFLAKAGGDPIALRKARISVNAIIRRARSLFSPKKLRHVTLTLPRPLPFEGIEFETRQSMKYRSEIDIEKLIEEARQELDKTDLEAYKVFLLALGLGLRRKEIDLLEWQSFRWKENVVRIEPTRYFHPKSEDSLADLPVDPELMDIFRKYYAQAKGSFVIRSPRPPLPPQPHQYFRCDPIFDRLVVWLRKHGLNGNKPLHTLRKEYGSLLTRRHGIHAASRALRHADLRTTSEHYSDSTARVTPDVGRLLVNIYVQVTVTAEDPDSGQLLRDPRKVLIEVPRAQIERYSIESPKIAGDTTDERLAEDLAGDFAPRALAKTSDPPPRPWRVDRVTLSGRPLEIEGRQPDLSFDSIKSWIV